MMDPVHQKLLLAGGSLVALRLAAAALRRFLPEKVRKTLCDYVDSGIAATFIAFIIATFLFQVSRVEGVSMRPTLHTGEYALIDKLSYRLRAPKRGDVIVFQSPVDAERDYIKRVICLPGDTVEVKYERVYINQHPVIESYIQEPPFYRFGPEKVPENMLFVLGDNRNNSLDSHRFHCLRMSAVRGRACVVIWPAKDIGKITHGDDKP